MTCLGCGRRMKRGELVYLKPSGEQMGVCGPRCAQRYEDMDRLPAPETVKEAQ